MKKAICIVGAGLVIGSVAVIYALNKKVTEQTVNDARPEPETTPEKEENLTKTAPKQQAEYASVKSQAVGNMYARHTGAADVVKSSVEAIHENIKTSEKTNADIDTISAELDDMLSED